MVSREEISELYERFGPALYRRAFSLLGVSSEAHEIVQETFLQFWSGRSRFRKASSPFTFLYRITTNLSIDRLRRRRTAGVQMDYNDELLHRQPSSIARLEAASELSALVEGMDSELITIAVLSHVDGLTQEEIADSIGVSRRTILKRLKKFKSLVNEKNASAEKEET